jgi:uncharacterized protein (DUF488 family)
MTGQRGRTKPEKTTIYSIGHSTRAIGEFIELLNAHGIQLLADIRTIPKSRHNPQFNKEELEKSLQKAGIAYLPMPGLGGLRHTKKDSPNTGWETAGFRGFADYMQTEEFRKSLEELIKTAQEQQTAIMCAEAVPWRCHRSLVADALSVRGINVMHIMSRTSLKEHEITPWAEVKGMAILYPRRG